VTYCTGQTTKSRQGPFHSHRKSLNTIHPPSTKQSPPNTPDSPDIPKTEVPSIKYHTQPRHSLMLPHASRRRTSQLLQDLNPSATPTYADCFCAGNAGEGGVPDSYALPPPSAFHLQTYPLGLRNGPQVLAEEGRGLY